MAKVLIARDSYYKWSEKKQNKKKQGNKFMFSRI